MGTNEFPNLLEKMGGDITKNPYARKEKNGSAPTVKPLAESRAAQVFEKIRLLSEQHSHGTGEGPKVFVLHLSDSPQTIARSVFSMNFFGCGGFEIVDGAQSPGICGGVAAALRENPLAVAICGSDEDYKQLGVRTAKKLKDMEAGIKIVVAGSRREGMEEAGVDDFINTESDVCYMLEKYQQLFFSEKAGT